MFNHSLDDFQSLPTEGSVWWRCSCADHGKDCVTDVAGDQVDAAAACFNRAAG